MVPNTDRTARYAMIIEKDGTVSYIGNEPGPGVTVSSLRRVKSYLLM
jgi:peroxiredoxin